jgi:hypothetical protein
LSKAICSAHALLVVTYVCCCCCLLDVSTVASNSDPESDSFDLGQDSGLRRPAGFERPAGLELVPWPAVRRNPGFLPSPF